MEHCRSARITPRQLGAELFSINKEKGNVCVHPSPNSQISIDLRALVDDLSAQDQAAEMLSFMDILPGTDRGHQPASRVPPGERLPGLPDFYPIKVNQQPPVVEAIAHFGKKYNIPGSRLQAELGGRHLLLHRQRPAIICNGYKDTEFIETVLYATRIG